MLPKAVAETLATYRATNPEPRYIDAFYADLCGIIRGKRFPREDLDSLLNGRTVVAGSNFLMTVTGENSDAEGLGFSDGDPDWPARAIPGSLQPVPWAKQPTAQVMLTLEDHHGTPYYFEPRNVLRRVLEQFTELNLFPTIAFELEFYLVDHQRTGYGTPQPPNSSLTGQRQHNTQVYALNDIEDFSEFLTEVVESARLQGIPTGAISAEYAPAQFEINLMHCDNPLLAADHCVMFKRATQNIARKHGFAATFMSKPYPDQAGSGMHIHTSLYDQDGRNVFADQPTGNGISNTMRHALAGVLALLPESMAIFAPGVNSYRRYQSKQFVPVSPTWGFENRMAALRVPASNADALRIEHRVPGADANPYLALASMLAGIHLGIKEKMEPPPPITGGPNEIQHGKMLPRRLSDAIRRLSSGKLHEYLGERYVRAYTETKRHELELYERCVSPHEYDFYLTT